MNICRIFAIPNSLISKNISVVIPRYSHHLSGSASTTPMDPFNMDKEDFRKSLSETIDLHLSQSKLSKIPAARDRMKLVLNENLTGGKYFRGFTTLLTYKCVEAPEKITDDTLRIARNVGWCSEMFHAYLVIMDDIMDGSQLRRGKPCWYLRPETGLSLAVNDSIAMYGLLTEILKSSVGNLHNYSQFIGVLNETLLCSTMGQYLDIITEEKKNLSCFTTAHYDTIVHYKSAYYSFILPISFGLLLVDKLDEETSKIVEDISVDLGRLFQIQDDYIDCYGDESITGKIGTDIQSGKCTWLAVKALELCTDRQLTVFEACYGSEEPAHVERVKQLYNDLKMPEVYKQEENAIYTNLIRKIQCVPSDGLRKTFKYLLDFTYRRNA